MIQSNYTHIIWSSPKQVNKKDLWPILLVKCTYGPHTLKTVQNCTDVSQ